MTGCIFLLSRVCIVVKKDIPFSAIVIYLSLRAIAPNPNVFDKYHYQENLIFKKRYAPDILNCILLLCFLSIVTASSTLCFPFSLGSIDLSDKNQVILINHMHSTSIAST